MSFARLPTDVLAVRCKEDTNRFYLGQKSTSQHCFELLRRALADGLTDAFTWIYRIYEPQVIRWVYSHSQFIHTSEDADYFANSALSNFYFALRGGKFHEFDMLAQVMAYLKMCVHSAIMQHLRKQPPDTAELEDETMPGNIGQPSMSVAVSDLWARICHLLPEKQDRLLAHCAFVLVLKPAQITQMYPDHWATARDVSVALQRIRRRLRSDFELRHWAGIRAKS